MKALEIVTMLEEEFYRERREHGSYLLGTAETLDFTGELWEVLPCLDEKILQAWCSLWIPNARVEIAALRLVDR